MADGSCAGFGLAIRKLMVRGNRGRLLLSVPHLEIAPGAKIGITGPSGAGKSTLLFAMAGLVDRIEGQVTWTGVDLSTLNSRERARFRNRSMGIVFQDFLLFDELDAAANASVIALFRPKAERSAIRDEGNALLARLGINAGDRATSSLSGGERQRVAVARALAGGAQILLADEPTANLHREAADALADDLVAHADTAGRTLVTVSHDPALLERMDRVITLSDGQLTEI
ncbi:ABC transporter ATP-binding protein [Limimaricola cinnabarinus]|jgi:putative ABC transport system ATP-binding protein|uniref:ABC transporter ATP-binding protein n=1 Tax=Limimaricola cinnabarinus TaxID=1125964 RepID=A0A2G1MBR8_9RHOB|nr:ATP-binding cassette domain-containing protein [Limimaricola cinnabarinus]PHP26120.1 ABC transporter ATP-binding protein [Limimaricola cinnabarinus]